jgi:hypothetical protein
VRGVAPIGTRARRLLPATWVPLAAIAVHQLRFFLAYGSEGRHELTATGHSYLTSLTPWIVLLCALGAGAFLRRLALAWRGAEGGGRRRRSPLRLWLAVSLALILIYAGQELLEGLLSSGHSNGIAGIFGHGGWWAVPASLAVGGALTLLVRGGQAAIVLARRLGRRPPGAPRRALLALPAPSPVFVVHASPLACCAPGRAPPGL